MRPERLAPIPALAGGTVCTVGTFDGVHRGHRLVLERLAHTARVRGLPAVLVTFDPHPLQVVNPAAAPPLLTVGAEKTECLVDSPLDYVVILPFTRALAAYDAEAFVDRVLRERLGLRHLLIGYDHGFGRGRAGDTAVLQGLGVDRGFGVEIVPAVEGSDGRPISSTSIRRAVAGGDLPRAAGGLGRPYAISGTVVPGAGRGRALGFRTLNVALPEPHKLLPPDGVYAVRVQTRGGVVEGMMNLGGRPTFGETERLLEVHGFDVDGDFYGQTVRIDLIARLRETRRFDTQEALIAQLGADEVAARRILG